MRRAGRASLVWMSAVAVFLCFGVSTASAVVQVDPEGPAGQQYAFPLDSVRGEVAGNPSAGVPGTTSVAPLFGEGIRPGRAVGEGGGGKVDGRGDGSGTKGSNGAGGTGANGNADDVDPAVKELINGTGGGTSTTFEMLVLVGGLALVGLTAGLIGRRKL